MYGLELTWALNQATVEIESDTTGNRECKKSESGSGRHNCIKPFEKNLLCHDLMSGICRAPII